MSSIDASDLITPAQAARLKNVSREWIRKLMRRGDLSVTDIAGKPFVSRKDVMSYKPKPKTGRPPKPKDEGAKGKRSKKR
jgi:hypothetical protein